MLSRKSIISSSVDVVNLKVLSSKNVIKILTKANICILFSMNINGWDAMIAIGFNAAIRC